MRATNKKYKIKTKNKNAVASNLVIDKAKWDAWRFDKNCIPKGMNLIISDRKIKLKLKMNEQVYLNAHRICTESY